MRILVADKDPAVRMLVSTRLNVRGYTVDEVETSEECLRSLERQSYHLVLLSNEMERVRGKTLIETIRLCPHLLHVPILLMTDARNIAELVMGQERGFDDFLTKPFDALVLQLRVSINIARVRQRIEANALTLLPGNHAIDKVIREKIERDETFSVLYIDINHFKSFNDRYGFEKGDDVIRHTAKILMQVRAASALEEKCFIGHIGGDDFIVVLPPDDEESFARLFIAQFDRLIPTYYDEADRLRGGVHVMNRQGKPQTFPLMSCSVAACNNLGRKYRNLGEIARDAAEVKTFLKSQIGSHYLRDRRASPLGKLEEAVKLFAKDAEKNPAVRKDKQEVDPLGQILLASGLVTHDQLSVALKKHLATGQRLGQVLIGMNIVRSEDVGRMLEKKLNVPYVSLKTFIVPRDMLRLFTLDFIKSRRVVPLMACEGRLNLAMCDPFDLLTLDAIEQITGMKPSPCLALEDEFEEFVEKHSRENSSREDTG
jgi:diguanylate cyclase (GGDEF)-like protein